MGKEWNQAALQQYIDNQIEESVILEYKEARALDKTAGKKKEIAKDISAMANAAGGMIIYGVSEYQEKAKKHLPEKLDAIDRTQFSKEWLDQIINNHIHPRIHGLVIHPVDLNTGTNHTAYVVEIPQSTTAHQVTTEQDYRYYERANFEVIRMPDYRIRDVMNRGIVPNIEVQFFAEDSPSREGLSKFLNIEIHNPGNQVVNYFKLDLIFPDLGMIRSPFRPNSQAPVGKVTLKAESVACSVVRRNSLYYITYRSRNVLFPKDSLNIGDDIGLEYNLDFVEHQRRMLEWTLYADNMPPKQGEIAVYELEEKVFRDV